MARPGANRARRPRKIRSQVRTDCHTFQFFSPIGEGRLQAIAAGPAPLPRREVRKLDRQRRKLNRAAVDGGVIRGSELTQQHDGGRSVENDVMHHHQQQRLIFGERDQHHARLRAGGEVKRTRRRVPQQLLRFGGARLRWARPQIMEFHRQSRWRDHHLARRTFDLDELRSQRFVARDERVKGET